MLKIKKDALTIASDNEARACLTHKHGGIAPVRAHTQNLIISFTPANMPNSIALREYNEMGRASQFSRFSHRERMSLECAALLCGFRAVSCFSCSHLRHLRTTTTTNESVYLLSCQLWPGVPPAARMTAAAEAALTAGGYKGRCKLESALIRNNVLARVPLVISLSSLSSSSCAEQARPYKTMRRAWLCCA